MEAVPILKIDDYINAWFNQILTIEKDNNKMIILDPEKGICVNGKWITGDGGDLPYWALPDSIDFDKDDGTVVNPTKITPDGVEFKDSDTKLTSGGLSIKNGPNETVLSNTGLSITDSTGTITISRGDLADLVSLREKAITTDPATANDYVVFYNHVTEKYSLRTMDSIAVPYYALSTEIKFDKIKPEFSEASRTTISPSELFVPDSFSDGLGIKLKDGAVYLETQLSKSRLTGANIWFGSKEGNFPNATMANGLVAIQDGPDTTNIVAGKTMYTNTATSNMIEASIGMEGLEWKSPAPTKTEPNIELTREKIKVLEQISEYTQNTNDEVVIPDKTTFLSYNETNDNYVAYTAKALVKAAGGSSGSTPYYALPTEIKFDKIDPGFSETSRTLVSLTELYVPNGTVDNEGILLKDSEVTMNSTLSSSKLNESSLSITSNTNSSTLVGSGIINMTNGDTMTGQTSFSGMVLNNIAGSNTNITTYGNEGIFNINTLPSLENENFYLNKEKLKKLENIADAAIDDGITILSNEIYFLSWDKVLKDYEYHTVQSIAKSSGMELPYYTLPSIIRFEKVDPGFLDKSRVLLTPNSFYIPNTLKDDSDINFKNNTITLGSEGIDTVSTTINDSSIYIGNSANLMTLDGKKLIVRSGDLDNDALYTDNGVYLYDSDVPSNRFLSLFDKNGISWKHDVMQDDDIQLDLPKLKKVELITTAPIGPKETAVGTNTYFLSYDTTTGKYEYIDPTSIVMSGGGSGDTLPFFIKPTRIEFNSKPGMSSADKVVLDDVGLIVPNSVTQAKLTFIRDTLKFDYYMPGYRVAEFGHNKLTMNFDNEKKNMEMNVDGIAFNNEFGTSNLNTKELILVVNDEKTTTLGGDGLSWTYETPTSTEEDIELTLPKLKKLEKIADAAVETDPAVPVSVDSVFLSMDSSTGEYKYFTAQSIIKEGGGEVPYYVTPSEIKFEVVNPNYGDGSRTVINKEMISIPDANNDNAGILLQNSTIHIIKNHDFNTLTVNDTSISGRSDTKSQAESFNLTSIEPSLNLFKSGSKAKYSNDSLTIANGIYENGATNEQVLVNVMEYSGDTVKLVNTETTSLWGKGKVSFTDKGSSQAFPDPGGFIQTAVYGLDGLLLSSDDPSSTEVNLNRTKLEQLQNFTDATLEPDAVIPVTEGVLSWDSATSSYRYVSPGDIVKNSGAAALVPDYIKPSKIEFDDTKGISITDKEITVPNSTVENAGAALTGSLIKLYDTSKEVNISNSGVALNAGGTNIMNLGISGLTGSSTNGDSFGFTTSNGYLRNVNKSLSLKPNEISVESSSYYSTINEHSIALYNKSNSDNLNLYSRNMTIMSDGSTMILSSTGIVGTSPMGVTFNYDNNGSVIGDTNGNYAMLKPNNLELFDMSIGKETNFTSTGIIGTDFGYEKSGAHIYDNNYEMNLTSNLLSIETKGGTKSNLIDDNSIRISNNNSIPTEVFIRPGVLDMVTGPSSITLDTGGIRGFSAGNYYNYNSNSVMIQRDTDIMELTPSGLSLNEQNNISSYYRNSGIGSWHNIGPGPTDNINFAIDNEKLYELFKFVNPNTGGAISNNDEISLKNIDGNFYTVKMADFKSSSIPQYIGDDSINFDKPNNYIEFSDNTAEGFPDVKISTKGISINVNDGGINITTKYMVFHNKDGGVIQINSNHILFSDFANENAILTIDTVIDAIASSKCVEGTAEDLNPTIEKVITKSWSGNNPDGTNRNPIYKAYDYDLFKNMVKTIPLVKNLEFKPVYSDMSSGSSSYKFNYHVNNDDGSFGKLEVIPDAKGKDVVIDFSQVGFVLNSTPTKFGFIVPDTGSPMYSVTISGSDIPIICTGGIISKHSNDVQVDENPDNKLPANECSIVYATIKLMDETTVSFNGQMHFRFMGYSGM